LVTVSNCAGTLFEEEGWSVTSNPKELTMKKIVLTSACILALSAGGAFAQSSQGKAGSDNGPTSNSPTTNSSGSAGMSSTGASSGTMRNDGTTGAGTGSSAPSSSGNVGPGTNNNSGKQPGGR
jgi:hypothetical protein